MCARMSPLSLNTEPCRRKFRTLDELERVDLASIWIRNKFKTAYLEYIQTAGSKNQPSKFLMALGARKAQFASAGAAMALG
mmetsp:Transcript_147435/g.471406  ORF Transcript_147435/g.471406 Transcript_147435/m.471406 type:complete len:81 (+) Transcript_147435:750-992(+)